MGRNGHDTGRSFFEAQFQAPGSADFKWNIKLLPQQAAAAAYELRRLLGLARTGTADELTVLIQFVPGDSIQPQIDLVGELSPHQIVAVISLLESFAQVWYTQAIVRQTSKTSGLVVP